MYRCVVATCASIKHVIKNAVFTNQMQASIVRVSCLQRVSLDEALKKEEDFSKEVIPLLKDYLP